MVNRSLLVFVGGVCMAIAYGTAQEAKAESIDIIFSGTVPHTCTIASPSQSPASAVPSSYRTTLPDVACNDGTQVNDEHWTQSRQTPHAQNASDQWANQQDTSESIADGHRTITPQ